MQNEWITLSSLGTFGGTVFAVTLMSQFLKGYVDHMTKVPTRFLVLVLAWVVLVGRRTVMTGDLTGAGLFLDFLNGFLVALAAMGTHAMAKDHLKWQ